MRAAMLARKMSDEVKARIGAANTGKKRTAEVRARMAAAATAAHRRRREPKQGQETSL